MRPSITVLAPAFYPSPRKVKYLIGSAERYTVPIRLYGLGEPYKNWVDVQITRLYSEIQRAPTSHILYTDASDAIFLSDLKEIWNKYVDMDEPEIVMSKESSGACAGGWMARKNSALRALETIGSGRYTDSNPQIRWRQAIVQHMVPVKLDTDSEIFQVTGPELREVWPAELQHPRLFNPKTQTQPCILHFAGGYTDHEVGKAALIEPIWRSLGYDPVHQIPDERPIHDTSSPTQN